MTVCPEIKQKHSQDRKTHFQTVSLPVAKDLSPVARQAPTKLRFVRNKKGQPEAFLAKVFLNLSWVMDATSAPKCLLIQDFEGLTEVFSAFAKRGACQRGLRKLGVGHHQLHANYVLETWSNHDCH